MTSETERLRKILQPMRGKGRLQEAPTREAIPVAVSEASPDTTASLAGSNGWNAPLDEDGAQRTVYSAATITSADGLAVFVYEPAQQLVFYDQDSVEIVVNLDAPT